MLALMQPGSDPHFSLCIFKMLGITFCPGCGLGNSISYLFHGNIQDSFSSHPLGIFAVFIILLRVYKLMQLHFFSPKGVLWTKKPNNNYGTIRL